MLKIYAYLVCAEVIIATSAGVISAYREKNRTYKTYCFHILVALFVVYGFAIPALDLIGLYMMKYGYEMPHGANRIILCLMALSAKPIICILKEVTPGAFRSLLVTGIDMVKSKSKCIFRR